MLSTKNICFAIICTLSCLTHNFLEPAMEKVKTKQERQEQKNANIKPFVRKRFAGESILTQAGSALSWNYYSLFSMLGKRDPNVQKEAKESTIKYVAPFLIADLSNKPWFLACYKPSSNFADCLVRTHHYLPKLKIADYTQELLKSWETSKSCLNTTDFFVCSEDDDIQEMRDGRILAFCPSIKTAYVILMKDKQYLYSTISVFDRQRIAYLEIPIHDLRQTGYVSAIPENPGIEYRPANRNQKQAILNNYSYNWEKSQLDFIHLDSIHPNYRVHEENKENNFLPSAPELEK